MPSMETWPYYIVNVICPVQFFSVYKYLYCLPWGRREVTELAYSDSQFLKATMSGCSVSGLDVDEGFPSEAVLHFNFWKEQLAHGRKDFG